MADLTTPERLAQAIGQSAQSAQVRDALARASARFVGAVGWPVLTTTQTLILDPPPGEILHLPGLALRDVTVKIGGQPVADVEVSPRTGVLRRRGGWGRALGSVSVTFTSGWDTAPEDVQDAVLEQAAMTAATASAPGVSQMSQGGRSIAFSVSAATGTTERWSSCVERYRVRSQVGV